jgi:hypothetical protein
MKLVKTAGKLEMEHEKDKGRLVDYFDKESKKIAKKPVFMNLMFGINSHVLQSVVMALGVLYLQFHGDISPKDGIILFLYVSNLGRFFQDGINDKILKFRKHWLQPGRFRKKILPNGHRRSV